MDGQTGRHDKAKSGPELVAQESQVLASLGDVVCIIDCSTLYLLVLLWLRLWLALFYG